MMAKKFNFDRQKIQELTTAGTCPPVHPRICGHGFHIREFVFYRIAVAIFCCFLWHFRVSPTIIGAFIALLCLMFQFLVAFCCHSRIYDSRQIFRILFTGYRRIYSNMRTCFDVSTLYARSQYDV